MSRVANQWGEGGAVDTCTRSSMISIPSQARTDPPDKRSLSDEATSAEGNSSTATSPRLDAVTLLDETAEGQQQQQQHQPQRHHHEPQQQKQRENKTEEQNKNTSPTRPLSYTQVWRQQEQERQQQQQQEEDEEQQQRQQHEQVDANAPLTLSGDGETCNSPSAEWKELSAKVKKQNSNSCSGKHKVDDDISGSLADFHGKSANQDFTPVSSPSLSPRKGKCRRQGRVYSADEPAACVVYSNEDIKTPDAQGSSPQQDENRCKLFLDGNPIDLSPERQSEHPLRLSDVSGSSINLWRQQHENDVAQSPQDGVHSEKRSSAEQGSILSFGVLSDDNRSDAGGSIYKKKKKKKRKSKSSEKNKSTLSLTASHRSSWGGAAGGDNQHQHDASDGHPRPEDEETSRPPSATSSTKGARRLAKRGIGMFPSSNWRRLRNTLKAANEMQGPRKHKHTLTREDSFLRKFSTRNHQNVHNTSNSTDEDVSRSYYNSSSKFEGRFVIQHDGNFMFYWLGVVTLSVLYNLWTCIAREAFKEIQQECPACWYSFDALVDIIYICDIIVQFRTGYLDQGLMVYDSKKLRQRYTKSKVVYIDFICLLPLDLLQFLIGVHPMMRFPRFLKIYRPFRFLHMLESRTAYPNLIRVANLTHILFLGAHWFAAFYYMISEAEGFKGEWAYPKPVGEFANVNRKYLRSLFWSTLTLTTIGDLPPPDNSNEYVFVIVSYLIGVFVFATIVGQVGNVINNRNASRQEFERLLDGAKIYMQTHNVPPNLQKRVQRWYDYVWSRGRLNGCDINSLGLLPDKLKTELAIHVNLETLKKVTIFQECQPEFLHDLVLKMKAYIFTPGDLICRRGEVAREMFIIADGVVEIISETGVMLKRMGAGDFFGEIGILNLDGGINRRTADVRSVGYLELFVLSREDVLAALKDHPEAESIIRDYGQRRLREVEAHRQKVKPLKCRGSTLDQPGNQGGTQPTVQNRLLQTLRSLNPAVRRQSAQVNHHPGSPPPSGQAGSPGEAQRRPSAHEDSHFSYDEIMAESSPKLSRLRGDSGKSIKREESGKYGRSHPMSIIQQATSDLTYQQIAAEIQTMQEMIDKRLTQLEEVYSTTTSRLDKLVSSQDMLVRLLKQQMIKKQDGAGADDDDDLRASCV